MRTTLFSELRGQDALGLHCKSLHRTDLYFKMTSLRPCDG
jgi:hypothetical protein